MSTRATAHHFFSAAATLLICAVSSAARGEATSGPARESNGASPSGYHLESTPSPGLVIAGTAVLGTAYGIAAVAAVSSKCSNNRWMLLPLAGPWITAARYDHNYQGACDDPEALSAGLARMDGVVQGVGAALLASSFLFPSQKWVRNDASAGGPATKIAPRVTWWVTPVPLGSAGGGVAMLGRF
jgi:hypothetical protein